ncbi:unnamed protein product [Meloidogyne enterolobii]|uniref:Uncharacterized protein n=1 Tax=Meloidogyne enterolobii TaxID=390850 RepID=A0ACB0ZVJ3_MELEN
MIKIYLGYFLSIWEHLLLSSICFGRGSTQWQAPRIVDYNGNTLLTNVTNFFFTPVPPNGFLEELPNINQQVNIHSSIRKLEIVSRLPLKEKQKNRYKRDDGIEEEEGEEGGNNLETDEAEGEEKLEEEKNEKNRGVRLIVDEIEDKSLPSSSQIKDRKTFSKKGQTAGKNENGKLVNSGSRQRGYFGSLTTKIMNFLFKWHHLSRKKLMDIRQINQISTKILDSKQLNQR